MVNERRLGALFEDLVRIDSVSRKEGRLARILEEMLQSLGAEVVFDGAGPLTGSDTGNLIARFEGSETEVPPLLLNAHMDTVEPGEGVRPERRNGVYYSDGSTILGADDKSAIAVLIEGLRCIREQGIAHGPLEVVLTVCEEIGLLGAKHLDYSLISAKYGFCLDSSDVWALVTRAPALNQIQFTVYGRGAHAGAEPEKGVNAIQAASKAVAGLSLGRIDEETTANIGVIEGGRATNIVPDEVRISGEVRSHDMSKLDRETTKIVQGIEQAVASCRQGQPGRDGLPKCLGSVKRDFSAMHIPSDHYIVALADKATRGLRQTLRTATSGGGSDGNIFFEHDIVTGIMGTGMKDVHSVRESVALKDMIRSSALLTEIIRTHAKHGMRG